MDYIQRRVINFRRRPCLEFRHVYDRVERTANDRLRERQHVRGEAHPLLRNLSSEEASSVNATISSNTNDENQSNISLNNYCGVCGLLPGSLDAHMISSHPGCGMFWESGICGHHLERIYILCHNCKKKYSAKNQDDMYLHTQAPDIIYNEEDLTEVDMHLVSFNIPSSDDNESIQQCLGINEKIEGIPMER